MARKQLTADEQQALNERLHFASEIAHMKDLLDAYAEGGEVDTRRPDGSTPLISAAGSRNPQPLITKLLLAVGADAASTGPSPYTSPHLPSGNITARKLAETELIADKLMSSNHSTGAVKARKEIIALLEDAEKGIRPDLQQTLDEIIQTYVKYPTAPIAQQLKELAQQVKEEYTERMAEKQRLLNDELWETCSEGSVSGVASAWLGGAQLDAQDTASYYVGYTALMYTAGNTAVACVQLLLALGADTKPINKAGDTAGKIAEDVSWNSGSPEAKEIAEFLANAEKGIRPELKQVLSLLVDTQEMEPSQALEVHGKYIKQIAAGELAQVKEDLERRLQEETARNAGLQDRLEEQRLRYDLLKHQVDEIRAPKPEPEVDPAGQKHKAILETLNTSTVSPGSRFSPFPFGGGTGGGTGGKGGLGG